MNLRAEETLTLVKKELEKHKLLDYLGAGVFITGGCARLDGMEPLAAQVFGLPGAHRAQLDGGRADVGD